MRVAMFASEMDPYVKTGGLADVISSLPKELLPYVDNVDVFIPYYRNIKRSNIPVEQTDINFSQKIGSKHYKGKVFRMEDSGISVYLIDNYHLFRKRSDVYVRHGKDYPDNLERFVFFCKGALRVVEQLSVNQNYNIFHCHDWQTALIPLYTKLSDFFQAEKRPLTVYTIHNLAYQGKFPRSKFPLLQIPRTYLEPKYLESWGKINLMKAGLLFADELTTVSPTYAQEIQTKELGVGLHEILASRQKNLTGILNGVDYSIWNPKFSSHLSANYSSDDLAGKRICKKFLQKYYHLPVKPDALLTGIVSRLAWQKGMDLVLSVLPDFLSTEQIQFVLLGTGDSKLEEDFLALERQYPKQVGIKIGFGEALAHQIEAGIDVFLMPSRYEPCGLNDKYSLKYGSVPIVHCTGGLADSVIDYQTHPNDGTGFVFGQFNPDSFKKAVLNALKIFQVKSEWVKLIQRGMQQDFSWSKSAEQYLQVYKRKSN
ncbi:starch synthase [Candidatus Heimdallarchaeota archaeon B3_Heim]|nr:MAG: starch synthase [Candidatus Heimdallarchaeota archaeon B3_Heim]